MFPQNRTKSSLFSLFKETLLAWSKTVDINGVNKILLYKHSHACQLIWLIVLLASTCATIWIITLNICKFFEFDVVSQIKVVYEKPTQFPAVTICNNDGFTSHDAQLLYELMASQSDSNTIHKTFSTVNQTLNTLVKMYAATMSDDEKQKLGFDKRLILSCSFFGQRCENDLHWYYSYYYGNCWQFNAGVNFANIKQATHTGEQSGLSLVFHPLVNQNRFMTSYDTGLVVFVHNNSKQPTLNDRVYANLGKSSNIMVKKTISQSYPYPYSTCQDLTMYSSDLYDLILYTLNKIYNQPFCFELCIQQNIIRACNCYAQQYSKLNDINIKPCLTLQEASCVYKQEKSFVSHECQTRSCPLECEQVFYDLSISTLTNPSLKEYSSLSETEREHYEKLTNMSVPFTYDLFKSLWAGVYVYYPSLDYTLIVESPKLTLIELLAEIGGSLGLFVSFSVFSLFEFIELLVLFLKNLYNQPCL